MNEYLLFEFLSIIASHPWVRINKILSYLQRIWTNAVKCMEFVYSNTLSIKVLYLELLPSKM